MTRLRAQRSKPAARPVHTVAQAHEEALRIALDLAGGDRRRIVVEPDGAVMVVNNPRRPR